MRLKKEPAKQEPKPEAKPEPEEMRICKYCGVEYPISEGFHKNQGGKGGYESRCKKCKIMVAKESRRRRRTEYKNINTSGAVIAINFSGRENIYRILSEMAERELRTPADQLLYLFIRDYTKAEPTPEAA